MRKPKQSFEVDDEEPIFPIPERIKEEHLSQTLKNIASLKELTLELRKKEASKPIYLVRYE